MLNKSKYICYQKSEGEKELKGMRDCSETIMWFTTKITVKKKKNHIFNVKYVCIVINYYSVNLGFILWEFPMTAVTAVFCLHNILLLLFFAR